MPSANEAATTIFVSTTQELRESYELLSQMEGGGEIVIESGAVGVEIYLVNGGDQPVTIRSEDPENPTTVTQIHIRDADNIEIRDMHLDSTGLDRGIGTYDPAQNDLYIKGADNIVLDNVHFSGQAEGIYDPANPTEELGSIRYSSNVSITNGSISDYFHGLFLYESSGLTIENNEIFQLQGDGIRMEGVQDVRIASNNMHSFYGSPNAYNHDDMIQMWTVNTQTVSRDIEIVDNIFNSSDAAGSQTILIQNEREQDNPENWYQNITIANNVIYNSHTHGIRVSGVNGVEISDNTVLWNTDSGLIQTGPDDTQSLSPTIQVYAASNAIVTGNIAGGLSLQSGVVSFDNVIVNYVDPDHPNYIDNHFVNASTSGTADLRDLSLREDSSWLGLGSSHSQPDAAIADDQAVMQVSQGENDLWEQTFSADMSTVEGDNVAYVWTFEDGTVLSGQDISHQFHAYGEQEVTLEVFRDGELVDTITRSMEIDNRNYVDFDFTQGPRDMSGNDLNYWGIKAENMSPEGYQIGGSERFFIGRDNEEIHGLDHFALDMELALDSAGQQGTFFHLHGSMQASIDANGEMHFILDTDDGSFRIRSGDVRIQDAEMHRFTVSYDADARSLQMFIDGEQVSEIEASGSTTSYQAQNLVIGYAHGSSLNATIGSIYLGYDENREGPVPEEPEEEPEPTGKELLLEPQILPSPSPTAESEPEGTVDPEPEGDTPVLKSVAEPDEQVLPSNPVDADSEFEPEPPADPVSEELLLLFASPNADADLEVDATAGPDAEPATQPHAETGGTPSEPVAVPVAEPEEQVLSSVPGDVEPEPEPDVTVDPEPEVIVDAEPEGTVDPEPGGATDPEPEPVASSEPDAKGGGFERLFNWMEQLFQSLFGQRGATDADQDADQQGDAPDLATEAGNTQAFILPLSSVSLEDIQAEYDTDEDEESEDETLDFAA